MQAAVLGCLLAAQTAEIGDLERDGLWLIGLGALIVVSALLIQGPHRGAGGLLVRDISTPLARLSFALGVSGTGFIAAGSVLIMISALPRALVIVLSLVAVALATCVIGALQTKRDANVLLADEQHEHDRNPTKERGERIAMARLLTGWRWWLLHPYGSPTQAAAWAHRRLTRRP